MKIERLGQSVEIDVTIGYVIHASKGVQVILGKRGLAPRQGLFMKLQGPAVVFECRVTVSQVVHAVECVGMIGTEAGGPQSDYLLAEAEGLFMLTESKIASV